MGLIQAAIYGAAFSLFFIACGAGLLAFRISRRTGQTMMQVLRGDPGEERKQSQRSDPGEER
jgi:hypothetical protein